MVYRSAFVRISARDSARQPTTLPAELRSAHEAGQFFLTLEVAAKLRLPALADLEGQIRQRLPSSLLNDTSADWRQWPMRVKPLTSPETTFSAKILPPTSQPGEPSSPSHHVPLCVSTESNLLEVTDPFPVGYRIVEGLNLQARHVRVKFDDMIAEGTTRHFALVEQISRFAQRLWQGAQLGIDVGVAVIILAAIELLFDARHPGGEHRRNPQIRIRVRARQAVLDAKGLAMTHHAKADRPVVV